MKDFGKYFAEKKTNLYPLLFVCMMFYFLLKTDPMAGSLCRHSNYFQLKQVRFLNCCVNQKDI